MARADCAGTAAWVPAVGSWLRGHQPKGTWDGVFAAVFSTSRLQIAQNHDNPKSVWHLKWKIRGCSRTSAKGLRLEPEKPPGVRGGPGLRLSGARPEGMGAESLQPPASRRRWRDSAAPAPVLVRFGGGNPIVPPRNPHGKNRPGRRRGQACPRSDFLISGPSVRRAEGTSLETHGPAAGAAVCSHGAVARS